MDDSDITQLPDSQGCVLLTARTAWSNTSNSLQAKLGLCSTRVSSHIRGTLGNFGPVRTILWTLFICCEALCFWEFLRTENCQEWNVEPWIHVILTLLLYLQQRHHSRTPCGSAHAALLAVMVLAAALSAAPWLRPARTGHSTWHSFLTCWVNQEETPHVHLYCINKQKAMKADSVRAKLCRIHRIEEHSNNDSFAMDDSWPFDPFDTAELGPSRGAVSSRVWDHRVHGSDCSRCCHLAG